jgi:hypothetical protein
VTVGRRRSILVLALGLSISVPGAASAWCDPPATATSIAGEARRGGAFEQPFGRDLVFRLAPNPEPTMSGWTIEVRARGDTDPDRELSWLVTPPYRAWTPRYVDTSYGRSARSTVAFTPREFAFLASVADWETAFTAVRLILWPGTATDTEVDRARRKLETIETGRGRLHIVSADFGGSAGGADRIEALRFTVELCVR